MPHARPHTRALPRVAVSLALTLAVLFGLSKPAAALPRDAVGDLPFPRTALWWPAEGLSADRLARYDLLILGHHDRGLVSGLRQRNPRQLVLDSANACEIGYDPDNAAANVELRGIPAQWLLTQVGSTLSSAVDARATAFRVASLTGPGGLELFRAGDAVVIEGEIAYVWSVDAATRTLHVRRGAVNPPKPHAAGTRVAAGISFWGRDLVVDLSTYCPKQTADKTAGPEDWSSFNARRSAALLKTAEWDGLMVDRSDGDQSWLIGHSTARSIDPVRGNRLPASYRAFDDAWNAGLLAYERRLRTSAGAGKVIVGNWARPNLDLLDGNVFEAFPKDSGVSYNGSWRQTVFGPLPGYGGYLEWMAGARKPAVGLVATVDVDETLHGDPPPASGDPVVTPRAVRKARFGLGTALLGDGFFAYEYNVSGRGSAAVSWFDTYDGGGLGQGYLGRPKGGPVPALPPLTTPNLVTRGEFASADDLAQWSLMTSTGYAGAVALDTAASPAGPPSARIDITSAEGKAWKAHFTRGSLGTITQGREYTISFWAKADSSRPVSVWVQGDRDDTRQLLGCGEAALDGTWRRYELSALAEGTSGAQGARLHFGVGQSAGRVWIDGVKLQEGTTAVFRRDFSGGVVVVNAAGTTQTVGLGRPFRAFSGSQDPAVDDGSVVSTVTIPPLDARILVRTSAEALPDLDRAVGLWQRAAERAEAADASCRAAMANATGLRYRQLSAAASGWSTVHDRAELVVWQIGIARTALEQGDSARARRHLDDVMHIAWLASSGIPRRDPLPCRPARQARDAAAKASAATRAAHDILP